MNHETEINNQGIYKCLACGNEIIVPIDESAGAKQEFVDECPKLQPLKCHPYQNRRWQQCAGVGEGTFS